jgi:hypothetical protein
MDATFFIQFWPSFWATVIGGVVLTAIFFFTKENIFSLPSVSGTWECRQITLETANNPFKGMIVYYQIIFLQEKEKIIGTGEKDRDSGSTGNHTYSGVHRIPIEISGCIEKSFFRADLIHIHWSEDGTNRKSSTFHELKISGSKFNGGLFGKFKSTAGKCSGTAVWTRV